MEKEKVDILRRKMIGSGLAALATAGVIGVVVPRKAEGQQNCPAGCYACPQACYNCATCQTCQPGNSKQEPEA